MLEHLHGSGKPFLPKYVQVITDKLVTYNVLWSCGS